jgi:hypothetical protein
MVQVA